MYRFRGFTLVELLLVLVIIAVSTAGIAVSLKGRQDHYALKAASKDMAEAIRYAANEACMRELTYRIVFLKNNSYRVEKQKNGEFVTETGTAGRPKCMTNNVRIVGFFQTDGQAINPAPEYLVFDQTSESFSGQICLQGQSSRRIKIYVNGISGQVDIGE